jgi:hypothetical protein
MVTPNILLCSFGMSNFLVGLSRVKPLMLTCNLTRTEYVCLRAQQYTFSLISQRALKTVLGFFAR